MNPLPKKTLITGATEGVGFAFAQKLLQLGHTVVGVGRNSQKLGDMQAAFRSFIPITADLSSMHDLERLVLLMEQDHPDVDMLVNNAGIQYNYHFEEEPHLLNKIDHEVTVNLLAPMRLVALLLPLLRQRPQSCIVNVTSGLALVPKQTAPVYCASKAGLHIFSTALRHQLQGIHVVEVMLPLVETRMTAGRGRGKLLPGQVADRLLLALQRGEQEVHVGKVKWLYYLNRIAPALAVHIMKKY